MNIVTSLLRLQSDGIATVDDAHESFDQAVQRILSISLVHELLYQSENLAQVPMTGYVDALISQLRNAFEMNGAIEYRTDIDGTVLPVTAAIPCGIILNELITNAQKYAFRNTDGCTIVVQLRTDSDGTVALTVRDDGAGLPDHVPNEASESSLGLHLVRMLTDQLAGEIDVRTSRGTTFTIRFPM